jgi:protein-tyrosine-phosphatase
MSKKYNILFVCTGNSARSQLAEAISNTLSHGRFIGHSAGTEHTMGNDVHPMVVELVHDMGYSTQKMRKKDWNEYMAADAPEMDFVITLCDDAAKEPEPEWKGDPVSAHWSFPDPTKVTGNEEEIREAFVQVEMGLRSRLDLLLDLPLEDLDKMAIHHEVTKIGSKTHH